jgi:hypothetical protein
LLKYRPEHGKAAIARIKNADRFVFHLYKNKKAPRNNGAPCKCLPFGYYFKPNFALTASVRSSAAGDTRSWV